jgi:hypothetical protein
MELNKLVFGGLALGCLAAAGAGGYLAARQGTDARVETTATAPASSAPADVAAPTTPDGKRAVAESEGVITPEPAAKETAPAAPPAAPVITPRRESAPAPRTAPTRNSVPAAPARTSSRPSPVPDRNARPVSTAPAATTASSTPATSGGTMWEPRAPVEPERAPSTPSEPAPPPPPAAPEVMDLVVPADSVLGLQIERTVSSELARVEDRVEARVTRDVRIGDRVAIPAGSVVHGSVMEVERGGKLKERARLGIRFHTVVLADGSRLNIKTDAVTREGTSPSGESAAKIGGAAAGGAILGAILGGGKGAVIGGTIGAAGGTAATMAGQRNPAVLPAGTTLTVRVQQPVTVTVEK